MLHTFYTFPSYSAEDHCVRALFKLLVSPQGYLQSIILIQNALSCDLSVLYTITIHTLLHVLLHILIHNDAIYYPVPCQFGSYPINFCAHTLWTNSWSTQYGAMLPSCGTGTSSKKVISINTYFQVDMRFRNF